MPGKRADDRFRSGRLGLKSIRVRLGVAFAALVAIALFNVAVSVVLARQGERAMVALREDIRRGAALAEAKHRLEEHSRQLRLVNAIGVGPSSADLTRTLASLDSIPGLLTDGLEPLRRDTRALVTSWQRFYQLQETDPAAAVAELRLRAQPLEEELLTTAYPRAVQRVDRSTREASARVQRDRDAHFRLLTVLLAISIAGGLTLLLVTLRRLFGSIESLNEGAARFGSGDLEHRIPIHGEDELSEVAERFNWMAARFRETNAELRERHAELAETLERVQQGRPGQAQDQKMSALGAMLAGLAHELNNPLASVLGFGELVRDHLRDRPTAEHLEIQREVVEPLVSEALRARELVRNLLQFSRKSANKLEAVPIAEPLETVTRLRTYAYTQDGLELRADLEPGLTVRADAQGLQQVFLNLISNALDAMRGGRGTCLTIRARQLDREWVEVVAEDDGPGLPEPARVFEPFYTTKAEGEGTGLGLSIVHRLIRQFGGEITAENGPAGGAVFRIRLRAAHPATAVESARPAAPTPLPAAASLPDSMQSAARDGADPSRVLVVDDEQPIRSLQQRILEREGFEVLTASAGTEARDLLGREEVDLIISDVKMPGEMNGIALFEWVKSARPELVGRFLFVTGDIQEIARGSLRTAHPGRFLTKPFQVDEYLRHVRAALEGSSAEALRAE